MAAQAAAKHLIAVPAAGASSTATQAEITDGSGCKHRRTTLQSNWRRPKVPLQMPCPYVEVLGWL